MKPLLTHDWIEKIGGSEIVLKEFQNLYPNSEIFTLWNNSNKFNNVKQSFLKIWPLKNHKVLSILPSFLIWNRIKSSYKPSFILASSHSFAHHSKVIQYSKENKKITKPIKKLVYCHTPARWLWFPDFDPRGKSKIKKILGIPLKIYDYKKAQQITSIAANSVFVKERIKKAWGLNANVIYPPVDVKKIIDAGIWKQKLSTKELNVFNYLPKNYLLGASRLIDYKRLDIVIKAGAIKQMPVVIAGNGPKKKYLQELAKKLGCNCHFIESASNEMLYALYQNAYAYIFPAIEDFGIMPVECMATGTPVITGPMGGALECVEYGISGFNTKSNEIGEYADLIDKIPYLDKGQIIDRSKKFSVDVFKKNIQKWINSVV
jgi:glycosyltransferase involved in cell wall biosynthesis